VKSFSYKARDFQQAKNTLLSLQAKNEIVVICKDSMDKNHPEKHRVPKKIDSLQSFNNWTN
jgi:hypothetical protein